MEITSINLNKPMTNQEIIEITKKMNIDDIIQISEPKRFEYEVTFWRYPD